MIIVRRTYVPRPGQGGKLLALVRQASQAMADAGFKKPRVYRAWHGAHGTLYTEQEWDSIAAYESSRDAVRRTIAITSTFEQIYPLLEATHDTEVLESAD